MRIEELDYDLPEGLIAQHPPGTRDGSRLLVLDRGPGRTGHHAFIEIPDLLEPRSVLVLNDTKVFPARILFTKETGGRMEALLVRRSAGRGARETWAALVSTSGRVRHGTAAVRGTLRIEVVRGIGSGLFELVVESSEGTVDEAVDREGCVPLPPYIRRPPDRADAHRYQTVYARSRGSAAAPTAGLHFTPGLLDEIRGRGHETAFVTLHVGPGTFQPVRSGTLEEHRMHEEWASVGEETARTIEQARADGRRIVACGTTVVRALEAVAAARGRIGRWDGPVDLFIRPGHTFRAVDDLVTNFHLPRSTLLALVMALAGRRAVLEAYAEAVRAGYRFYSYGDAMLIRH